jgi:hypothetical protein
MRIENDSTNFNKAIELANQDKIDDALNIASTISDSARRENVTRCLNIIQRTESIKESEINYRVQLDVMFNQILEYRKNKDSLLKDKTENLLYLINDKRDEYDKKIAAEKEQQAKDAEEKEFAQLWKLIIDKKYDEAIDFGLTKFKNINDPNRDDWVTLVSFSSLIKNGIHFDSEHFDMNLRTIDPNYNGHYSKEVKEYILSKISMEQWLDNAKPVTIVDDNTPQIGMTATQVLDSSWGKPNDINRTTTQYGTTEQWVYDDGDYNYRFLYFENGVLKAIQE